jgi:hypothetical protein
MSKIKSVSNVSSFSGYITPVRSNGEGEKYNELSFRHKRKRMVYIKRITCRQNQGKSTVIFVFN